MRKKIRKKILIILAGIFLVFFVFILFLEILNLNKIAYGAKISGVEIGGKTTQEAENILKPHFENWQNQQIKFIYQNREFLALPAEIGIKLNLVKSVNSVYNLGRNKNILVGLWEQIILLLPLERNNLAPVYGADKNSFEDFAKKNFNLFENPAKNASLIYDFKTRGFKTTPEKEGIIFDRQKIAADTEKNIARLSNDAIKLVLIKDYPEVLENETNDAKEKAESMLENSPYEIIFNGKSWKVDKETLLDWLEFAPVEEQNGINQTIGIAGESLRERELSFATPTNNSAEKTNKILGASLNQEKIKNILAEIAPSINQEPVNAQLTFENDKVSAFSLSQDGIRLEIDKSAEKIAEKILHTPVSPFDANNPPTPPPLTKGGIKEGSIELIVERTPPQIATGNIDTLGLTALLGKGESNFAGSPKNRTHNIKVGSSKMNGILLKPGEEFSFAKNVGEIGPKQGYLPELVIKKNKTIPEYGGGICQVSTTIFRAAINSGLKITERHAHAFPVKYYNPQGFDATIYPPRPDLKFINDTPNNILLQSKIDGTKISFEIYGTTDNRETKIKGPVILSSGADGSMKTILYQQIWREGKMEREDRFFSNYKSPALYPVERNPLE